jgi:hypothetical protein
MYSTKFQLNVFDLVTTEFALLDDIVREFYHERMDSRAKTGLGRTTEPHIIESVVESNGKTDITIRFFGTGRRPGIAFALPDQSAVAFNDLIDLTPCSPEWSQPGKRFAIHPNGRPDGGTDAHDRILSFES